MGIAEKIAETKTSSFRVKFAKMMVAATAGFIMEHLAANAFDKFVTDRRSKTN